MSEARANGEDAWKGRLAALGAFIRAQRATAGLSLRDLSERTGVSNAYLSQVERGLHEPSLKVIRAVADALEVPLEAMLARAGVLDPDLSGPGNALVGDTEAAILHDAALSEPQRLALLSIYRSFVPPSPGGPRGAGDAAPEGTR